MGIPSQHMHDSERSAANAIGKHVTDSNAQNTCRHMEKHGYATPAITHEGHTIARGVSKHCRTSAGSAHLTSLDLCDQLVADGDQLLVLLLLLRQRALQPGNCNLALFQSRRHNGKLRRVAGPHTLYFLIGHLQLVLRVPLQGIVPLLKCHKILLCGAECLLENIFVLLEAVIRLLELLVAPMQVGKRRFHRPELAERLLLVPQRCLEGCCVGRLLCLHFGKHRRHDRLVIIEYLGEIFVFLSVNRRMLRQRFYLGTQRLDLLLRLLFDCLLCEGHVLFRVLEHCDKRAPFNVTRHRNSPRGHSRCAQWRHCRCFRMPGRRRSRGREDDEGVVVSMCVCG
eukprot:Opistho-2@9373